MKKQTYQKKTKKKQQQKNKKNKLEHKLILVTISNKHPETDIDCHEIKILLLIFNLLIEAESDKISTGEDTEEGIRDILITIAAKLLQLLHKNIDSLKLPDIKSALKKLKSFIVKGKKDGKNENDSENSSRPETSSCEGSNSS